jgi:ABC-2 type transport system permease protein
MLRKFRLIARREYLTNVRRRSFLLVTIGMPVLILAMMALSIVASQTARGDPSTIGYVDQSRVLAAGKDNPGFRSFPTVEDANASLKAGGIRGYYLLSPDYPSSGKAQLFFWQRQPGTELQTRFDSFLKANLVAGLDPAVAARVLAGPTDFVVRSADGSREMNGEGFASLVLPFVLGLFFSFGLMNASGYLLRAVSDEKESRTIEIMTTSMSPGQFIAGKAVGLVGVALTQVLLWALVVLGGLAVAAVFVDSLAAVQVSWSLILLLVAYFLPLFTLASTLMIMLGVAVNDTRQGQQIAGALSLLFLLPLFFSPLLGSNPDGPLMVVLTLFPTTSLLTVAIRWAATSVPVWQVVASWLILVGCAGAGLWSTPRVFRHGMLRYGRRMTLRAMFSAVRSRG